MMSNVSTMNADARASRRPRRDVDGILLLDKPEGMSSNRALQQVKALFNARKAGHTGSLDPLATGMLPICLGEATKVAGYLLDSEKLYRVRLVFGLATSTGDDEGQTVARGVEAVTRSDLDAALLAFRGASKQVPPMYSALKVNGQPLYRLARAGQVTSRVAREITIHELVIEDFHPGAAVLRVRCSKGTYIRTLVEDIAHRLGTVAHVAELRRLAVWPFSGQAMVTLEGLGRIAAESLRALDSLLLPLDAALTALPDLRLGESEAGRIRQGQALETVAGPATWHGGLIRLYGPDRRFLGVGERDAQGRVLPRRLIRAPEAATGCN